MITRSRTLFSPRHVDLLYNKVMTILSLLLTQLLSLTTGIEGVLEENIAVLQWNEDEG
jgi:hypothetical protein